MQYTQCGYAKTESISSEGMCKYTSEFPPRGPAGERSGRSSHPENQQNWEQRQCLRNKYASLAHPSVYIRLITFQGSVFDMADGPPSPAGSKKEGVTQEEVDSRLPVDRRQLRTVPESHEDRCYCSSRCGVPPRRNQFSIWRF
jgi:hypothetical protein